MNVVWFKRDLRTSDHAPLADAARHGFVLPLFIAEPELWQQTDLSGRQWAFASESLASLDKDLAELGQPLVIRVGDAISILAELHAEQPISALWSHEETGNAWTYERDLRVKAWTREQAIPWHETPQNGVIRRIGSRRAWASRRKKRMTAALRHPPAALAGVDGIAPGRLPGPTDLGVSIDSCPERQAGGREQALETLQSFLMERGEPYRRAMSSPSTGAIHCSRLSPHLAWGSLSMKEVTRATEARRQQLEVRRDASGAWRESIKSFGSRLHWHCHFMQKLEDEPSIEYQNLHPAYNGLRSTTTDVAKLDAWRNGETGVPFVDACMRSLNATGWINFRMRAMLMSFASYHLWLDWRRPGEHLARLFTDYEPGIHWSQVQMQSGTTGINTPRIYNPVKQGYDQDPDGAFVRRWVPELDAVPDRFVHEPWRWDKASSLLGKRYPSPVVDLVEAAREARKRIWSLRQGEGHRAAARNIANKHGSRKRAGRQRTVAHRAMQTSLNFNGD